MNIYYVMLTAYYVQVMMPDLYFGTTIKKKDINRRKVWTMSSQEYLKNVIKTVEEQIKKKGYKLPTRAATPMLSGYYPDTDSLPKLDQNSIMLFQEQIDILPWAVEIGRVDILTKLSMLLGHQSSPQEGHLEQMYHIFAFLKKSPNFTLYFDQQEPLIDHSWFSGDGRDAFQEQYRDAKEQLLDKHLCTKPHPQLHMSICCMQEARSMEEAILGSFCFLNEHL